MQMVVAIGLVFVGCVVFLAGAFSVYVSGVVRRGAFEPTRTVPPPDVEIVSVSADRIRLRRLEGRGSGRRWRLDGLWGLRSSRAHGRVGRIVDVRDQEVEREWTAYDGTPEPGDAVRIDATAWPLDPGVAFGLEFQEVTYSSPAGRFSGWICSGRRTTWVLFLHGKRAANPRKPPYSYPALRIAAELDFPCFEVSYRNDVDAPEGDGLHWYGLKEWIDLEAAAAYALDHGATSIILMGYSMGGAIALSFLYRSALAEAVAGIILDAPVLDLESVINHGITGRGVPPILVGPGLWLSRVRLGVDWQSFDHLRGASALSVPILLFHGEDDRTVPIEDSDRLAKLRPDIVTYLRFPFAGHADSWNVDASRYEDAVRAFLATVV